MSKCEKYWVFGMIWLFTVNHYDDPTILQSAGNVLGFVLGTIYLALMIWHFLVRGETR